MKILGSTIKYIILILNISQVYLLKEENKGFFEIMKNNLDRVMRQVILNETIGIVSSQCTESFNNTYLNPKMIDFSYFKILHDSSKNKNDVGSFNNCLVNKYQMSNDTDILSNFTYIMIWVTKQKGLNKTDIRFEEGSFMFGVCTINFCEEEDYKEIIYRTNNYLDNPLDIESKSDFLVYNVKTYADELINADLITILINLIPFFILVLQLFFMWFPKIPYFIFKNCFRTKNVKYEQEVHALDTMTTQSNLVTEFGFNNYKNNIEEKSTDDNNKSPTFIFSVSDTINNNPIEEIYKKEKSQSGTSLPKVTKSIKKIKTTLNKSLLYKFKSAFNIIHNGEELFLDKYTENNNDSGLTYIRGLRGISLLFMIIGFGFYILYNSQVKIYEKTCFTKFLKNPFFLFISFGIKYSPRILFSCSGFIFIYKFLCYLDERTIESNDNVIISYKFLFKFLMKQFYKYFIFIIFMLFFRFSLIYIISLITQIGPMFIFFKQNVIDEMTPDFLLGHIFLYDNFRISVNDRLNIFWMVMNEFLFFIFSTFIVFISYKKNFRMDILFAFIFSGLVIIRVVIFVIFNDIMFSTLFYYFDEFGFFNINPLYNYPFFLIGIFSGKINYIIQKEIRLRELETTKKSYLKMPMCFLRSIKELSKGIYTFYIILGLLILIIFSMIVPIVLHFYTNEDYLNDYFNNHGMNLFFILDTELIVFIANFIPLCLVLMGQNSILKFLSNNFWMIKSKIYFSYIMIINPILLYIFYRSESRIKIDYFNNLFFSIVTFIAIMIISCLFYICYELPYKRITNIILADKKEHEI